MAARAARSVLVVDDDERVRSLLRLALARSGLVVLEAPDGAAALDLVRRARPDLVLLDMMMPGLGGLEVCRRLRADPATRTLPVLMLSAAASEEDRRAGLESGADAYLTKPFSPRALLAAVAAYLGPG